MPAQMPPRIEHRDAMHYVAIASTVHQQDIGAQLPQLWPEVSRWLHSRAIAQAGAPFIRYLRMGSGEGMSVHVGIPVVSAVAGDARVLASSLPAGRYATLTYLGEYSGLHEANMQMHVWAQARGDIFGGSSGFGSSTPPAGAVHAEFYVTDPTLEPDASKWVSEVVLRLTD